MNERIGTFCEKCREVVCRCAEHEANLQKATDNVVRSKPSDSFNHWVEFLLGGSEETMKMKEEPISSEEKYYIMEKAGKPNTWVVHTKLVKDIPVTDEVLIEHLKKIQCKKGYLDSNDVCLIDISNSDSDYKFIATWWDEPTALANSEYRLKEDNDKAMEEQYQLTWDEVKYSWFGFEENNKHYISKEEEQLFNWFKSNYEPPKKKTT